MAQADGPAGARTRKDQSGLDRAGEESAGRLKGRPALAFKTTYLTALVTVTVLVEVSRSVAGMIVMLTGHFLLPCCVAMAVLIEVPRLVARMIMVLTRLFLCHFALLPGLWNRQQRTSPA